MPWTDGLNAREPSASCRERGLQPELRRKEKALAEAAALVLITRRIQALWGEAEEGRSDRSRLASNSRRKASLSLSPTLRPSRSRRPSAFTPMATTTTREPAWSGLPSRPCRWVASRWRDGWQLLSKTAPEWSGSAHQGPGRCSSPPSGKCRHPGRWRPPGRRPCGCRHP